MINNTTKKVIKIAACSICTAFTLASFVFYLFVATRGIVEIFKLLNKQSECLKNLKCSDVNKLCKSGSNNELAQYEDIDIYLMRKYCGVKSLPEAIGATVVWCVPVICLALVYSMHCIKFYFKKIRQLNAARPSDVEAQAVVSNERPAATAATVPSLTPRYTDQDPTAPPAYKDLDKSPEPPSYESLLITNKSDTTQIVYKY